VKVVKEILNQYCETWSSSEAQQQFLEYDLRIPSEWLHEALVIIKLVAQACFSDGMYSTCVVILPMIVRIEEIFIIITLFVHRWPVNSEVNCLPNLGGFHLFCHISFLCACRVRVSVSGPIFTFRF
jgi:hypothetical protein